MQSPPNIVREVFLDAVELTDPAEREAYLEKACGGDPELRRQVQALLQAHAEPDSLLDQERIEIGGLRGAAATRAYEPAPAEKPGTQIGPYKLLEQIGEGAFGVVFMAEQVRPVRRKVAVKILKPGMDTRQVVARFEAERQSLALMDDPHIARVFDAGATESGRPYFVMELIKGIPITTFCDERRLTTRERLGLFVDVCRAIQHAHQKGIIHRDVKPSNILVSLHDGTPTVKVIDFGIAKALGQQLTDKTLFTGFAQLIGTPTYMSPEQAGWSAVDVDTRSDVYSLGVLLYELLTGTTPFDQETFLRAGYDEMRRIIREEEPPRPSARLSTTEAEALSEISNQRQIDPVSISQHVRGELDWIVMKALEKDRQRRYESPSALAADVAHHLANEPVEACPPSALYRFKKFAHRRRGLLTASILSGLAIFMGTAVSIWQAVEATQARKLADERLKRETLALREEEKQRRAADEQRRNAETHRQKAEEHRRLAEANFQKAREAVDQMLTRVADEKLGRIRAAAPVRKQLLEDALKFYQQFLEQRGDDPELRFEVAKAWQRVGFIRHLQTDWSGAAAALDKTIEILQPLLREAPNNIPYLELLGETCAKLGSGQNHTGVLWQGLQTYRRLQELVPNDRQHRRMIAEIQMMRGVLGKRPNRPREEYAVDAVQEAIRIHRELVREDPQNWGDRSRLAYSLVLLVRVIGEEEFEPSRAALDEAEAVLADFPPDSQVGSPLTHHDDPFIVQAYVFTERADLCSRHGKGTLQEQESDALRAVALMESQLRAHSESEQIWNTCGLCKRHYAEVLERGGRPIEAVKHYREACEQMVAHYTPSMYFQLWQCLDQWWKLVRTDRRAAEDCNQLRLRAEAALEHHVDEQRWYVLKRRAHFRFESQRFAEALEDLSLAVENKPDDTSNLSWIAPAAVAVCPDDAFRAGMLALADKTIERTNGNRGAYEARSWLNRAMGNFEAARKDFDASVAPPLNHDQRYQHALLSLGMHDEQAYRADCEELARHGAESTAFDDLLRSAWCSVLAPKAVSEMNQIVAISRRLVEMKECRSSLQVLGAALFRAGQLQEALKALERAEAATPDARLAHECGWYFLAMIRFQLGEPEDARRWHSQAVESTQKILAGAETGWDRKLALRLLREECSDLVGSEANGAPPGPMGR